MTKLQVRAAAGVTVTSTAKLFDPVNSGTQTITLIRGNISADTDGVYQLQDGSGGTTIAAYYIAAKTQIPFDFANEQAVGSEFGVPGKALTAGNSLYCVGPSGGKVSLTVVTVETGP